jgi:hypothetical protein
MATRRKPTSKSGEVRRSLVQQLAAQIPWFHNCVLLDRVIDPSQREWYIRCTIEQGWGLSSYTQIHACLCDSVDRSFNCARGTCTNFLVPQHCDAAIAANLEELGYGG